MGNGRINTFPFFGDDDDHCRHHEEFGEPPSYVSFTESLQGSMDYNSLSNAFGMSCSSPEVGGPPPEHFHHHQESSRKSSVSGGEPPPIGAGENIPFPANSSASSYSSEAEGGGGGGGGGDDDSSKSKKDLQPKGCEDGEDEKSTKIHKGASTKKKGGKRQKQPRFSFLTKSEIDNLEDGYRWRKYGQKAVKNSPFPRSYYRCTSQKCTVKKRVERSYEDPTVVVTTYEGQHNHHCPATLRGNAVALLSPASFLASSSPAAAALMPHFPHELLMNPMMAGPNFGNHPNYSIYGNNNNNNYQQQGLNPHDHHQQQHFYEQMMMAQQPSMDHYTLFQDVGVLKNEHH
ncbi:unnamed protein product [Cuscuta campestris]|uniref:WRKY domain-containing protein n=1 Tax=Cuscuta campestris TaxID=132261 RepID=A0A484LRI6_9ASTE|nr:unnamed protein product [Cuscuta campestris]